MLTNSGKLWIWNPVLIFWEVLSYKLAIFESNVLYKIQKDFLI